MKIGQVLYKAGKALNDRCGYYTKRQCVRISANIGKELVDIKRAGQVLTPEILSTVAQKHVPKVNLNIIADISDYRQIALSEGYTQDAIEKMLKNVGGQHFRFRSKKGIYMPKLGSEKDASNFAHEFEHWMYNEHTFWRARINQILEAISADKPPKITDSKSFGKSTMGIKKRLEAYIRNFFGISDLFSKNSDIGLGAKHSEVSKFLAGENYKGLTNEKRITAYIRAICRNLLPPTDKNLFVDFLIIKNIIKDEVRAYKVSDIVNRYMTGNENISRAGFISDIYSRVAKVLDKECRLFIKNLEKENVQPRKTGLPINAYNELRRQELAPQVSQNIGKVVQEPPKKPRPNVIWSKPKK